MKKNEVAITFSMLHVSASTLDLCYHHTPYLYGVLLATKQPAGDMFFSGDGYGCSAEIRLFETVL
jgi:hypothetical protein